MNKYHALFYILCIIFFIGCRTTSFVITSLKDKSVPVKTPDVDKVASITLVLHERDILHFAKDVKDVHVIKLDIFEYSKIKKIIELLNEMNIKVVPWTHIQYTSPAYSKMIIKKYENNNSRYNEIVQLNFLLLDDKRSECAVDISGTIDSIKHYPHQGYNVEYSKEGFTNLIHFLQKEFQNNRQNSEICIITNKSI